MGVHPPNSVYSVERRRHQPYFLTIRDSNLQKSRYHSARMSESNIADLLALDTGALKSRLSELRRYL